MAQLAARKWRGAIVGPHGCGKSTLLETLKPMLRGAGIRVREITLRDKQRRLPAGFLTLLPPRGLTIVDGYEQLGRLERARLKRRCRRANCGLLVTSHAPTNIPTLIHLAPDARLVQQLVADLSARVSTPITRADVAASHACHGSNVREIFFDLYDRHERLRRMERTISRAGA
ncbi:MAG: molybdopterin-guanine dinucleotide biosynthesis protein B [Planctomycetes bacterium]|nr:molybdopterin-guanine dinucleotide biosynthesis protein B [Planctomycetota bacterium]